MGGRWLWIIKLSAAVIYGPLNVLQMGNVCSARLYMSVTTSRRMSSSRFQLLLSWVLDDTLRRDSHRPCIIYIYIYIYGLWLAYNHNSSHVPVHRHRWMHKFHVQIFYCSQIAKYGAENVAQRSKNEQLLALAEQFAGGSKVIMTHTITVKCICVFTYQPLAIYSNSVVNSLLLYSFHSPFSVIHQRCAIMDALLTDYIDTNIYTQTHLYVCIWSGSPIYSIIYIFVMCGLYCVHMNGSNVNLPTCFNWSTYFLIFSYSCWFPWILNINMM